MAVVPHQSVRAAEHGQGPTFTGPVVRLINAFQTPFNNLAVDEPDCITPALIGQTPVERDIYQTATMKKSLEEYERMI